MVDAGIVVLGWISEVVVPLVVVLGGVEEGRRAEQEGLADVGSIEAVKVSSNNARS